MGDAAAVELAHYPAEALAATEVAVVRIPAQLVVERAQHEPTLSHALSHAPLEHTRALVAKIDVVSAGSVTARLATVLLQLYERFGDENEQGVAEVAVPLSRTALARLVSARTETVIRALSSLQRSGALRTLPHGFAVPDRARLERIARSEHAPG